MLYPHRRSRMTLDAARRQLASRSVRDRVDAAQRLGHPESLPGRSVPAGDPVTEAEFAVAAEALRNALGDEDAEVRYAAAFSLAALGARSTVPALIDRLEDGNARVRQASAIALGRLGDPLAIDPLRRGLRQGPPDLRYQAAMSLAEIATSAEGIDADAVLDDLTAALADDDAEVRESVAVALGELGEARAAGWLGGLLEDTRAATRFEAAFALARLGDHRSVPVLLAFLDDKRRVLDALEALLSVPDERSREPLLALTKRLLVEPIVKVRAAAVLAALGDDSGRSYLCDRLLARRSRLEVVGMTVHVLAEMAGPWAAEALARFRQRPDSEPFREAIDQALERARGATP